jgi:hypothetical protein
MLINDLFIYWGSKLSIGEADRYKDFLAAYNTAHAYVNHHHEADNWQFARALAQALFTALDSNKFPDLYAVAYRYYGGEKALVQSNPMHHLLSPD